MSSITSGTLSVGGLASGLDTNSIVESLVNVKYAQLITPIENKIADLQEQSDAMTTFKSLLTTMKSKTTLLTNFTAFRGKGATSSDDNALAVTSVSYTATSGSYSILVNQLAQASKKYFTGVSDKDTTQFGTGTITIASAGSSVDIVIDSSNNTLQGIADAINAAEGLDVSASILNDGDATNPYRLVLTADNTGADSEITNNISSILTLTDDAALNAATTNIGQDAEIEVNSLAITSATNTFSGSIPGVTFRVDQVHDDPTDPIRVNVNDDTSSVEQTIVDMFSAYNDIIKFFQEQFTYDTSTNTAGPLVSDSIVQFAQTSLHSMIFSPYIFGANTYQRISQLGVTLQDDGLLTIDISKLEQALSTSPDEVAQIFQGSQTGVSDGMADKLDDYLYKLTNGADGQVTSRLESYASLISYYQQDEVDQQDKIDAYQAQLEAKFQYMEEVISRLNAQSDALDASLQSLASLDNAKK